MNLAARLAALRAHAGFRTVAGNLGWLTGDKVVRLGLGLVVGVAVARHLGPEQFGLYNYALSVVTLLGVPVGLGLDAVLVRELVRVPERAGVALGSVAAARLAAAGIIFAILMVGGGWGAAEPAARGLFLVLGLQLFALPLNTAQGAFQAEQRMRAPVLVANSVAVAAALARIAAIMAGAALLPFAWIFSLETLASALLCLPLLRQGGLRRWRWDRALLGRLLRSSWPLIVAGSATTIYMRADQVILRQLMGDGAVGIYAAAVRVSEIWGFVPAMIATAVLPSIVRSGEHVPALYAARRQHYFDLSALVSCGIALVVSAGAPLIIAALYGARFAGAAGVLSLHVWGLVFVFLGVAREQYLVNEGRTLFSLAATVAGALVNVGLNFLLIPRLGVIGAAVATLVAFAASAFLSSFVTAATRPLGWAALRALNPIGALRRLRRAEGAFGGAPP